MKKQSDLFDGYVCYGIGGYCEDKRAAKSWSYNRQSDWLCQWQIPSPQAEIAVAFRWRIAYLWFVYDGRGYVRPTARVWVASLCRDTMAITGNSGDLLSPLSHRVGIFDTDRLRKRRPLLSFFPFQDKVTTYITHYNDFISVKYEVSNN